jgi:hypothetical protein
VLDCFLTVLPITLSFLVRFLLVKYRIEALIMLYTMVKERSVRFSLQSGQRFCQTSVKLGQLRSNLVNSGQNSPNSRKCIPDHILRVFGYSGPQSGQKWFRSNLGQTWSTLVNLCQTWSDFGKCVSDPVLRLFDVMSPRWIRLAWFGLPRFTCRHPRKSRG